MIAVFCSKRVRDPRICRHKAVFYFIKNTIRDQAGVDNCGRTSAEQY